VGGDGVGLIGIRKRMVSCGWGMVATLIGRVVAGLCGDHQIPTMLRPTEHGRHQVGCNGQANPGKRAGRAGRGRTAGRGVVAGKIVHDIRAGSGGGPGRPTGRELAAESYASRQESESGIMEAAQRREVWLRGNIRPVAGLAVITAVAGAGAAAGAAAAGLGWAVWLVGGSVAAILAAAAAVAQAAAAPRLARDGDRLEVRLAPGRVERVPLEVVECVFRGSELLPEHAPDEASPRFRVGTLVIRFAERASAWKSRPAFRPWGTWDNGHAVIDGRWCEPLSRETVQRIAADLLAAKRAVSARAAR